MMQTFCSLSDDNRRPQVPKKNLDKPKSNTNHLEWSSVETEESPNSSSDKSDSSIDEAESFNDPPSVKERKSHKNLSKRRKNSCHQSLKELAYEPSIELLAQISRDLNKIEREHRFHSLRLDDGRHYSRCFGWLMHQCFNQIDIDYQSGELLTSQ